jgi:hypothetical protein
MDETQPLLGNVIEIENRTTDKPVVDFDSNGDPENPLEWPRAYKIGVVFLLAFMSFTV